MTISARRHIASTIGLNIKARRDALNMTQRDLALILDTNEMAVSRWERGMNRPSAEHEVKLADALFDGNPAALYMEKAA